MPYCAFGQNVSSLSSEGNPCSEPASASVAFCFLNQSSFLRFFAGFLYNKGQNFCTCMLSRETTFNIRARVPQSLKCIWKPVFIFFLCIFFSVVFSLYQVNRLHSSLTRLLQQQRAVDQSVGRKGRRKSKKNKLRKQQQQKLPIAVIGSIDRSHQG